MVFICILGSVFDSVVVMVSMWSFCVNNSLRLRCLMLGIGLCMTLWVNVSVMSLFIGSSVAV